MCECCGDDNCTGCCGYKTFCGFLQWCVSWLTCCTCFCHCCGDSPCSCTNTRRVGQYRDQWQLLPGEQRVEVGSQTIIGATDKGFPDDWAPNKDDIQQGSLGDCYLLAVLINNCDNIRDCFVNYNTFLRDGKAKFKFNRVLVKTTWFSMTYIAKPIDPPIIIEVDNNVIADNDGYAVGNSSYESDDFRNRWVNLLEEAFTRYLNTKDAIQVECGSWPIILNWSGMREKPFKFLQSDLIDGGMSFIPEVAISGKISETGVAYFEKLKEYLYKSFNLNLNLQEDGRSILISNTPIYPMTISITDIFPRDGEITIKGASGLDDQPQDVTFYKPHVYAVTGIGFNSSHQLLIRLTNPHAPDSAKPLERECWVLLEDLYNVGKMPFIGMRWSMQLSEE